MKPYKTEPMLKERIWGGQKLKQYNKSFEAKNIGESWETDKDEMPVLIKLIDANDILSVQVHPNDELAWELEGQRKGKTEAWIVLDCDEGAELIAGLKQGTTQSKLEQALENGGIQELLNTIKVKRGDCIYIPAGTVHSLGKGIVIYEVQQPSDLTYRLHDWDRIDESGKFRELNIFKAMKSIDYNIIEVKVNNLYELSFPSQQLYTVFKSRYFTTSYLQICAQEQTYYQSNSFTALTIISGSAYLCYKDIRETILKGDTWVIPEGCEVYLHAIENAELIMTKYP